MKFDPASVFIHTSRGPLISGVRGFPPGETEWVKITFTVASAKKLPWSDADLRRELLAAIEGVLSKPEWPAGINADKPAFAIHPGGAEPK